MEIDVFKVILIKPVCNLVHVPSVPRVVQKWK